MSDNIRDLVIIGGGPSALTAALYAAREDIDAVVYEKGVVGGTVAIIDEIHNYPGYPDGIEGMKLAEDLEKQAKRFGAEVEYGDVNSVKDVGEYKVVIVDGSEIKARSVLIATGRRYGDIGAIGEKEYFGKGVHYCATCDGAFYRGKKLAVIGGANSAIQESIYLTRFATHIDLLVRSTIKASKVLQHDLQKYVDEGKISVYLGTVVEEFVGDGNHVNSIRAKQDGKEINLDVDGAFIFAGLKPNTEFLADSGIEMTEAGFVKSDNKMRTNIPGIFVSGDVRDGATMQITSASGDGTTAAISIREYLQELAR